MISLPPLWACTLAGGLLSGAYGMHTWHKAQAVDAIETARDDERDLQHDANQASARHADALLEQQQTAALNAGKFDKAIHEKNRELAACRVDAAVVELLDAAGELPDAAGDPAEPRPSAARAQAAPDSTADVELGRCRANYADVCVPNALQLRDLQGFTRDLIRNYNCAIGRCD